MGSAPSMLTQYDMEEVQRYCNTLFSQQEIVAPYQRFCQLDRNAKGFISDDEFLYVPEFAMNPLSQQVLRQLLKEAGYSTHSCLTFHDFIKVLGQSNLKEVPVE